VASGVLLVGVAASSGGRGSKGVSSRSSSGATAARRRPERMNLYDRHLAKLRLTEMETRRAPKRIECTANNRICK